MPGPLWLVRRYLYDGINRHDLTVLAEVVAPDYRYETAGHVIAGATDYLAMVEGYLAREPTIAVTVHEVFTDGPHVAVHLTKHTAAPRAAWSGVLLYAGTDDRLTGCWAEQDWVTYRRHKRGAPVPDVVAPQHDPWAVPALAADASVAAAGLAWLEAGRYGTLLRDAQITVNRWFVAGRRLAFHLTERGIYAGGLEHHDRPSGATVEHHVAGFAVVGAERVSDVHVVEDRDGLARRLAAAGV